MSNVRTLTRSFANGELSPELFGRPDLAQFQTGLALCQNFITLPHGPCTNRPGFEMVCEVKNSANPTRLIPFTFNQSQTFAIELGAGYFRFITNAAVLLDGETPYEVANSYAAADLFQITYVQSSDIITTTHKVYPPSELRRYGATNWTFGAITFGATITAPTGVTATPTGTGTTNYQYVVTAVASGNLEESLPSSKASCNNNLNTAGNQNTIAWGAVANAVRYNVYKYSNGLYGYIGQSGSTSFVDNNITPDISQTPAIQDTPFTGAGNYPAAVSYFEQRRSFGGTTDRPLNLWMTRSGTESNLNYSIPTRDDDRIAIRIAAREASAIKHLVPLANLIVLTASGTGRVTSLNSDAITPNSISVRPQTYVGAGDAQPVVANTNMLYSTTNGRVHEMRYDWQANGYITLDRSIMAPHLFDYMTIVDKAFAKAPTQILWCVSSCGKLLGMTYLPEQQVWAWHQHTTDGLFESVTTVNENNEDMLYAIIRRTINGQTKRFIERMRSRRFETPADAFFVDCGATYSSEEPVTTISGVTWLEGKTINILADGAVHRQLVVQNGSFTLDQPARKIQFGLPITATMQTLPLSTEAMMAFGQGCVKNVNKVTMRVLNSSGVFAGPSLDMLTQYKQRTTEPLGSPPALKTDEIEIDVQPDWGSGAQIYVQQADPLPITVLNMTLEVVVGG